MAQTQSAYGQSDTELCSATLVERKSVCKRLLPGTGGTWHDVTSSMQIGMTLHARQNRKPGRKQSATMEYDLIGCSQRGRPSGGKASQRQRVKGSGSQAVFELINVFHPATQMRLSAQESKTGSSNRLPYAVSITCDQLWSS